MKKLLLLIAAMFIVLVANAQDSTIVDFRTITVPTLGPTWNVWAQSPATLRDYKVPLDSLAKAYCDGVMTSVDVFCDTDTEITVGGATDVGVLNVGNDLGTASLNVEAPTSSGFAARLWGATSSIGDGVYLRIENDNVAGDRRYLLGVERDATGASSGDIDFAWRYYTGSDNLGILFYDRSANIIYLNYSKTSGLTYPTWQVHNGGGTGVFNSGRFNATESFRITQDGGYIQLIEGTFSPVGTANTATIWAENDVLKFRFDTGPEQRFEGETHASEHQQGGNDVIRLEDLASDCSNGQIGKANGTGGVDCAADDVGGGGGTVGLKESGVTLIAAMDTLDLGPGFDCTESPTGEGNCVLDYTEDPVDLGSSEVTGTLPISSISGTVANLETALTDATKVYTDNDPVAETDVLETITEQWIMGDGASFPFEDGAGIAQVIDGGASADTIRWNWAEASNFKVTLDEDTWIENPTNISQGYASMRICQPAGGNLAIVPGAGLDTAFDAIPVIHEGANECTTIFFQSHDGTNLAVSSNRPEKCTNTWEFGARAADVTIPDSLQYRVPSQWTIVELRAMHRVAGDSLTTYDVQAGGSTSILSTLLTIDAAETTSQTAAALYAFATDHTLADDEIIEVVLVSGETQTTIPQEATVTVCYIE